MSYAEGTKVPVIQSQQEIRRVLEKYKATGFAFGEQIVVHLVMFEMQGRRIRIVVPIPVIGSKMGPKKYYENWTEDKVSKESRRRWRCLLITIKAKLECVETGITTLEEEFLAHIVLPGGRTMGQVAIPQIAQSYTDGQMPPLLGYGS